MIVEVDLDLISAMRRERRYVIDTATLVLGELAGRKFNPI